MRYDLKLTYRYCLILSAVILSACGGSSDNDKQKTSEVYTGSLSGIPVKGLHYETETLSGMTDERGRFKYKEGELISFSLGQTQIGATEAASELSPFDLLGISPPTDEVEIVSTLKRPMISSLDLVLNTSALLFSLDVDGNLENGIDLGSAHHSLKEKELEIASKAKEFASLEDIRNTVMEMVNREPVAFMTAAHQLYKNLQLSLEVNRVAASNEASSNNQNYSTSSHYNEQGKIEKENIVFSGKESPMELNYEYDAQNRLTRLSNSYTDEIEVLNYNQDQLSSRTIKNNSSLSESVETFSYNEQGQLNQIERDQDGDGTADSISSFNSSESSEQTTISENINGSQREFVSVKHFNEGVLDRFTEDHNNDGVPELEFIYTYDENSRMTSRRTISQDSTIESDTSYFEYDDQGRMIRYSQDTNNDEVIDYIEAYGYDVNDNRTTFRRDFNADNRWDFVASYRFDSNGNRIEINEDTDGNGIVDMHWQAEFEEVVLESNWENISAEF